MLGSERQWSGAPYRLKCSETGKLSIARVDPKLLGQSVQASLQVRDGAGNVLKQEVNFWVLPARDPRTRRADKAAQVNPPLPMDEDGNAAVNAAAPDAKQSDFRTWSDSTGGFQVEAKLLRVEGTMVNDGCDLN